MGSRRATQQYLNKIPLTKEGDRGDNQETAEIKEAFAADPRQQNEESSDNGKDKTSANQTYAYRTDPVVPILDNDQF